MPKPLSAQSDGVQIEYLQNQLRAQRAMVAQLKTTNADLQHQLDHNKTRQWVKTVNAVLFSIDHTFQVTAASPNIETYIDLTPQQIKGRLLTDFIHADDTPAFKERCDQITPNQTQTIQLRLGTPSRGYRWMRAGVGLHMKQDNPVGCQGVLIDIDKGRRAHDVPARNSIQYRDMIENLQEGYYETDLWGRFTFCNQALLTLSGYRLDELIERTYRHITTLPTARAMQALFGSVYKSSKNISRCSHEVRHKLGHTLIIEYSVGLIVGPDGKPTGFRGLVRDVSEQVKTIQKQEQQREQLYQDRKMNALGTLAGGLAHGFNNVLMAIQGNLSLMRMQLSQDHPLQKNIDRIDQAAEKGSRLAREILSFAKIGKFVVMPTNMNKIIKSTCRMLIHAHPHLAVHENLDGKLWRTQVDRVQLGQALLSLYLNAAEAMPDGGDLYLKSENTILDESDSGPFEAAPGRYVKISVTDSGIGLGEKAMQRIFEPFYCAYRSSRYDDLGLAAAYGTIKSHGGIIRVNSKKGDGATFTFFLPAMPVQPTGVQPTDKTTRIETVLIVDDDELCAQAGRDILERLGYRVMTAANGREAIELYADCHGQINLVLLDVILPDIDGDHIYQEMKKYNPEPTVVVASGYNVNQQVSALLNQGCVDFIQKPFVKDTLANKVRAALDRTAVPPAIAHLIS